MVFVFCSHGLNFHAKKQYERVIQDKWQT